MLLITCLNFGIAGNKAQNVLWSVNNLYYSSDLNSKESVRSFHQHKKHKYLIKYYFIQKSFSSKIHSSVSLAHFIFVVSHLKIHPD